MAAALGCGGEAGRAPPLPRMLLRGLCPSPLGAAGGFVPLPGLWLASGRVKLELRFCLCRGALGFCFTLACAVHSIPEARGNPVPCVPIRWQPGQASTFPVIHPSVRLPGMRCCMWEGQSLLGVCGDGVTLGIAPRESTRDGLILDV